MSKKFTFKYGVLLCIYGANALQDLRFTKDLYNRVRDLWLVAGPSYFWDSSKSVSNFLYGDNPPAFYACNMPSYMNT